MMASNPVDERELITYVLSGATETLCVSLDPAQVIRRLISTHHLKDDDKREINSFPRMDEKVEKLLEIMKLQDKAAYDDFMRALEEFHPHLYGDVYKLEVDYHNGARPKIRIPRSSTKDQNGTRNGDPSGGAKAQDCSGHTAQQNTFNLGPTYNTTHNMSTTMFQNSNSNVNMNCVNIYGDQTIVGGNVYNIQGNCEISSPHITVKETEKGNQSRSYKYTGPGHTRTRTTYTQATFNNMRNETKSGSGERESKPNDEEVRPKGVQPEGEEDQEEK